VLCAPDFFDPFEERIRPFVKGGFVHVLRAAGAQSGNLFLVRHIESRDSEDGLHGVVIEPRHPLDDKTLGLLQYLLENLITYLKCVPSILTPPLHR
jgi:hypothetical protein